MLRCSMSYCSKQIDVCSAVLRCAISVFSICRDNVVDMPTSWCAPGSWKIVSVLLAATGWLISNVSKAQFGFVSSSLVQYSLSCVLVQLLSGACVLEAFVMLLWLGKLDCMPWLFSGINVRSDDINGFKRCACVPYQLDCCNLASVTLPEGAAASGIVCGLFATGRWQCAT